MTAAQTKAQRLADSISRIDTFTEHQRSEIQKAAAELRRLDDLLGKANALARVRGELIAQQQATIRALNGALGGTGSTTTDNLTWIERLEAEIEALREKAAMHDAIQRACAELPQGADLHIELENGAGTVRLYLPDTDADITDFGSNLTFVQQINAAIDTAMQEKQS